MSWIKARPDSVGYDVTFPICLLISGTGWLRLLWKRDTNSFVMLCWNVKMFFSLKFWCRGLMAVDIQYDTRDFQWWLGSFFVKNNLLNVGVSSWAVGQQWSQLTSLKHRQLRRRLHRQRVMMPSRPTGHPRGLCFISFILCRHPFYSYHLE